MNQNKSKPSLNPSAIEKALERLQQGVTDLIQTQNWQAALSFKAKFYQYSFFNTMLIMSQCPDASLVAGYRKWQELGRQVKKGEKGISILAPLTRSVEKKSANNEADRSPSLSNATRADSNNRVKGLNPDDNLVLTDAGPRALVGFRSVYVFDVSQTEGEDLPQLIQPKRLENRNEDEPALRLAITKLLAFSARKQIKVDFELKHTEALGCYYPRTHSISLKADLSPLQTLKTFIHELAHALLHDLSSPRIRAELEAESCAYLVCQQLGLDSSEYSFPYLANWVDALETLIASGEKASKAAEQVLEAFEPKDRVCLLELG